MLARHRDAFLSTQFARMGVPVGTVNSVLRGDLGGAAANQILSDMKTDGTMAKIYEKWMGVAPREGSFTVTPMPVPTSAQ